MGTVTVELLRPHQRAGVLLMPPTRIEIPEAKLDWFERTGTARAIRLWVPPERQVTGGEPPDTEEG